LMSLTQFMGAAGGQCDFNTTNLNEMVDTTEQLDMEIKKLQANPQLSGYSFREDFHNS
jgi:hypothetical protein